MGDVQAHADALLALARAAPPVTPALTVYDGAVPDQTQPPYAVAYIYVETPDATSMTGASDHIIARMYTHAVGSNAAAARAVAQRLRSGLLDARPTIAGRSVAPIQHEQSQPPERDDSTGVVVMDQLDVWRLDTYPG